MEIKVTHGNRGFLCAPFLGIGVKEDISATSLTVLVHYEPDLTRLQLGNRPAKRRQRWTEKRLKTEDEKKMGVIRVWKVEGERKHSIRQTNKAPLVTDT